MRPYLKSAISLLTLIALVTVFCKSLAYREQADSAKADMLFERGQLFEQNEQMDSAAYYYRQAITMLPVARDDRRACIFRNRLGKLFLDVNLFPMAETVYREAMDCVPDGDDKTELSKATRGLGKSFLFRGIIDSALVYLNQAVRLTSSVSETNERLQAYSNLSLACAEVGDLTRSLEYNEKALALASDSIDYFRNWYARASLMTNFQQYDSAWHYYKLAAGSPNLYTKTGCYIEMAHLAHLQGRADSAKYLRLHTIFHDSIERMNLDGRVMTTDYEFLLKQGIETERSKSRHILSWMLVTGLSVVLLLCSYLLLMRAKIRKKDRESFSRQRQLYREKEKVEKKMIDLQESISQSKKQMKHYVRQQDYLKGRFFADCDIRPLLKQRIARLAEGTATKASERILSTDELAQLLITTDALFGNFASRLQLSYGLGDTDLHLCCLLKLGIKSNHIGLLLNVSSEALRKRAQRLCKNKFKTDLRLEEFIASFQ